MVGLAVTDTRSVLGVLRLQQVGETDSQLPPVPVVAETEIPIAVAFVVPTVIIWGSGLAPPKGMVKLSALIWLNTLVPTNTFTGTVMLVPGAVSRRLPVNVPATSPPPGKFATWMPTDRIDGAVPLLAETVNQFPPSDVVGVTDQFNVPDPAFRISTS